MPLIALEPPRRTPVLVLIDWSEFAVSVAVIRGVVAPYCPPVVATRPSKKQSVSVCFRFSFRPESLGVWGPLSGYAYLGSPAQRRRWGVVRQGIRRGRCGRGHCGTFLSSIVDLERATFHTARAPKTR